MTLEGGCVVGVVVRDAVVAFGTSFGISFGTSRFASTSTDLASASGSMTPKGFCLSSAAVVVAVLPGPTRIRVSGVVRAAAEIGVDAAGVVTGVA